MVTGLGAVSPIGNTRDDYWHNLVAGTSGVGPVTLFDASDLSTTIAAEVKGFDPDALIGRRDARKMDRYAQFAFVAANEAIADAKLPEDPSFRENVGAIIGTGIGGINTLQETAYRMNTPGNTSRVSPFFIPMLMANAAPAHISMHHGFRGPLFAAASACASSNDAIATAFNIISRGDAPAMLTGGAEATIIHIAMGGFCSMKAFSTRNDDPAHASRPFDAERDGFVLAEGAAMLVLEDLESALARGARIYCELLGIGQSADAYNLVAPDPDSQGVMLALRRALKNSGLKPEDVDYVNAHGTSTPLGDMAESQAIERVFGEHALKMAVSSIKGMIGHALGAAGALEGVACALTVYHDIIPPTINYEHPDPACRLDYVPNVARKARVNVAISNSFGFGGHNGVLVFRKYKQ